VGKINTKKRTHEKKADARKDIDLTGLAHSNVLEKRQTSLEKRSQRRVNAWIENENDQVFCL